MRQLPRRMEINGTDYSRSIASLFGSSHLDANGSLQAVLRAGSAAADGSGQTWYKAATVQFLPQQ